LCARSSSGRAPTCRCSWFSRACSGPVRVRHRRPVHWPRGARGELHAARGVGRRGPRPRVL